MVYSPYPYYYFSYKSTNRSTFDLYIYYNKVPNKHGKKGKGKKHNVMMCQLSKFHDNK